MELHHPIMSKLWDIGGRTKRKKKTKVSLQFNRGNLGTPKIFHCLLKTNIHTLLSCPVYQWLSWIEADSSARKCSQRIPNRMGNLLYTDQLMIIRIHSSLIIPSLTTFYQPPTLKTVAVTEKFAAYLLKDKNTPRSTEILIITKT